jgi:2-dehydropantoate 2-reductase
MRFTIIGAGGVGGYFGAKLAKSGCDVGFVARGAHLAAVRQNGLRVESQLGDIHLPEVRASDDPAAFGAPDYVFVCVKLWDTEAAVRALSKVIAPHTTLLSFQNGVQKDELLRKIAGDKAVMGGVAYIGAGIARPGVIRHTGTMQKLAFGEFDGAARARSATPEQSPRAVALLEACTRAGIDAELSPDIRRAIWEKFVFIVGLSALTGTTRKPVGPVRSDPRSRALLLEVMKETVAVGRAHGVALPEDFAEKRMAFVDTLPPEMTSSMHHDLEAGKRLEVDWLSGAVVELGKAVGLHTPVNRAITAILSVYASGSAAPAPAPQTAAQQ